MFIDVGISFCNDEVVELARRLRYSFIACLDSRYSSEPVKPKVIPRLVLKAAGVPELRRGLSTVDSLHSYITMVPGSIQVARWSAHDDRVDAVMMTSENMDLFDKKQFNTMRSYGKPLEVSVKDLLSMSDTKRSQAYRRLNLALRIGVKLIVGSGAEEPYELYHPLSIVYILSTMYDVPRPIALASITTIPHQVISGKHIREKAPQKSPS